MIVIGAKGFAKELLEDLVSEKYNYNEENLFFFDDISEDLDDKLFGIYKILRNYSEVEEVFKTVSREFTIGIGTPKHRKELSDKFIECGGELVSVISEDSKVGSFDVEIENGALIMASTVITNSIKIGKGTLVNLSCTIGHDCTIGNYVEISPNVSISGHCKVGNFTSIGTGAIVIPKVKIGDNCIIGAGTVVTKDIPDNCVVVGVPGKIIKTL